MQRCTRRSELFLESIVENIPHMIFVKDAHQLRFVRFNKAGEELLGHTRQNLIGKSDYDLFPKDEADFFTGADRDVLKNRELLDISEEPILTKGKGLRYLHTKKIPILDESSQPLYLLGISKTSPSASVRRPSCNGRLNSCALSLNGWMWCEKKSGHGLPGNCMMNWASA